jgi:hypothetical protein
MAEASVKRRRHGEDAIYFESAKNRYVGAISLGYATDGKRIRRKVSSWTKHEVRNRLKALHAELDAGSDRRPGTQCATRWRTGCARAWTADPSGPAGCMRACLSPQ